MRFELLFFFLISSFYINAQEDSLLVFELAPAYIQSPFLSDKNESPTSIQTIQIDKWIANNDFNVMNALRTIPGLQVQSGASNTHRITVRGVGTRTPYSTSRVSAYFNGIPLAGGDGEIELDDWDASVIQKISVVKGGKSAVYGAGLGGAIFLNSQEYFKKGWHGQLQSNYGVNQLFNNNISLTHGGNGKQSIIHYSKNQTEGWRQNSNYNRDFALFWHQMKIKKHQLFFLLNYRGVKAFIPSSLSLNDFENEPTRAAWNWAAVKGFEDNQKYLGAIQHHWKWAEQWKLENQIYFQNYKGYESRPFNILEDEHQRIGSRSQLIWTQPKSSFRIGANVLYERYHWSTFETNNGEQGQQIAAYEEYRIPLHFFGQSKFEFGKWTMEAGLSYSTLNYRLNNEIQDTSTFKYQYAPVLSPFIGVHWNWKTNTSFFLSAGQGFSYPTVGETIGENGVKNTNLGPEYGYSIDLGMRSDWIPEVWRVEMAIYAQWLSNMLLTERLGNGDSYSINGGNSSHFGIELSSNALLYQQKEGYFPSIILTINANTGRHVFRDFINDNIDYSGNQLPGIPAYSSDVSLKLQSNKGWLLQLQYHGEGRQFLNDSNQATIDGYHWFALQLAYEWAWKDKHLRLTTNIDNLSLANFAPMVVVNAPSFGGNPPRYYYPGQVINARVGLEFGF